LYSVQSLSLICFLVSFKLCIHEPLIYSGFSFLQLSLDAGEEVEIDYEVDGWYHVSSCLYFSLPFAMCNLDQIAFQHCLNSACVSYWPR